jgi:hypothetical protein
MTELRWKRLDVQDQWKVKVELMIDDRRTQDAEVRKRRFEEEKLKIRKGGKLGLCSRRGQGRAGQGHMQKQYVGSVRRDCESLWPDLCLTS